MKFSKSQTHRKSYILPELRFEDQQLSSFSGLVVFQKLIELLDLKKKLRGCFRHQKVRPIFGHSTFVLLLVVHFIIGYRELRQVRYYQDDPIVLRVLGLKRLPDVSSISRHLSSIDKTSVDKLGTVCQTLVLERITKLALPRITIDFDGSVIGTGRAAEGTAVGFNRKKKGQRSYYPLFCTVAQTGQVLSVLHRSGNVHDSNGADLFIQECIEQIRAYLPRVIIELRMDSAFFSDSIVTTLEKANVEYTISVPFERFTSLKSIIEERQRWQWVDEHCSYFERQWNPDSWNAKRRFVFVRQREKVQNKEPVQLDLFTPFEWGYTFKVIVSNKTLGAKALMAYHNGRGSQEGLFAELKSQNTLSYVPTRTWLGNQVFMLSAILAHNLSRELQMIVQPPTRKTLNKRPALWEFMQLNTLRQRIVQRAGRLIRPNGKLTLSMSSNVAAEEELLHILDALDAAA
jgi:hypothetical protein